MFEFINFWQLLNSDKNSHIEKLEVSSYSRSPLERHIHFKNVKHFCYMSIFDKNFPFTFAQLEKLELFGAENMPIVKIIKQIGKLVELSLSLNRNISGFLRQSKELEKFSAITFSICSRRWDDGNRNEDFDALAEFVNEKSLALKMKILYGKETPFGEYLESKIDKKKWKLNYTGEYTSKVMCLTLN